MSFQIISAEGGGVSPALLKPPRGSGAQDTPVRKSLSVLPFRVVIRLLVAQRMAGPTTVRQRGKVKGQRGKAKGESSFNLLLGRGQPR